MASAAHFSRHYGRASVPVLLILLLSATWPATAAAEQPSAALPAGAPTPATDPAPEPAPDAPPVPEGLKLDRQKMRLLRGNDNDRQYPQKDVLVRRRPMQLDEHKGTLLIENLRIDDVVNQKAIDVGLVSPDRKTDDGEVYTYSKVIVRNCEISNVRRDTLGQLHTLHIDFLRICGGGDAQTVETDVLVEDCYMRTGDALPLVIQDGKYGTITLRRLKFENTGHGSAQIAFINSGRAKTVVVEDSPGLRVALMGKPGTVEQCIVRNSPGAVIVDPQTPNGRTGAKIVYADKDEAVTPITAAANVNREKPSSSDKTSPPPAAQPGAPKTKVTGPPKLSVEVKDPRTVLARLDNVSDQELAFIQFEAFDELDYRLGSPVIVTTAPWEATLPAGTRGRVKVSVTVTKLGGNPEKPISTTVDVTKK